jgi:phosphoribosylformimino-5-aminoimidazole carboxamide ribotide isomerase
MSAKSMIVLPVLDVQRGQVVRGIGGLRREYRPLTPECHPIRVARAFRKRFGLEELYLADLDAISGKPPALDLFADLRQLGFRLWVDAGVSDASSAERLFAAGIETVVVGLETVAGPRSLQELCNAHAGRIVFSLDLKDNSPLGNLTAWECRDARSIAERAIQLGVNRLLLLDLARVGMNAGTGTDALAAEMVAAHPDLELAVGGGVRDTADLRRLKTAGVRAVLIASALHDGRVGREDLDSL